MDLAAKRQDDSFSTDFGIGPGDILQISVPEVPELKNVREERVSPQGTIELPIAGTVSVGGLTEPQVHDALVKALSRLVKDPQVDVFVKSYASRQVAVVGMVNKPGLYTLNRRNESILDLIGQAGGMSDGAGSSIIFIPASPKRNTEQLQASLASLQAASQPRPAQPSGPAKVGTAEPRLQMTAEVGDKNATSAWSGPNLSAFAAGTDPIFINATGDQSDLSIPVRPGDLIMVPARGQVLVQGWVATPGAYQITPGMTALGAVTAAGGELYSSDAVVLRATPNGEKVKLPVDLSKVEKGEAQDVQVQSGDVVIVQRSVIGAVPYSLYFLVSHFATGMMLPAF
ncbi:MAG TPA: polysaccharide biosynthesis/export family protein [Candidatus Binataceae bacterium]|nr:polysaccharide biosynthesis/export family protein [Candidatus Binataceae bacterium]